MQIFEVFRLPFHLGCLDRLQIQHEEKGFIVSASSNMAVLASIWGAFFFLVTFKLPFHALPLLSPHPASFRSFTPGASSQTQPSIQKLGLDDLMIFALQFFGYKKWPRPKGLGDGASECDPQQKQLVIMATLLKSGV